MITKLIINTEFFLECYGSCVGCFLSDSERKEKYTYYSNIKKSLIEISEKYHGKLIENLIIGFGRGNILNLSIKQQEELIELIKLCESLFSYKKITFEISTSMIGKIEQQILVAENLLSKSKNIFFNIVVNSEIVSNNFWINLNLFYKKTSDIRKSWGWKEDWGDIIVLNINPVKLPNLSFIKDFTKEHKSPINISIFPYEKDEKNINIKELNNWTSNLWDILHKKDFNVKNFLKDFNSVNIEYDINEILNHNKFSEDSYLFVDKSGLVSKGMPSIMGEVDYLRLVQKYNLNTNVLNAYKEMQKDSFCATCDYQNDCLVSGAYLNMLANKNIITDKVCKSGYQQIFIKARNKYKK